MGTDVISNSGHWIIYPLLFIVAFWIGLWLLKEAAIGVSKLVERAFLPIERRIYQWLQDRAMSRTLGVSVDVVRVRRRIETADKAINVPTSDGGKRHC